VACALRYIHHAHRLFAILPVSTEDLLGALKKQLTEALG
jgi:hypothetical protein